MRGMFSLLICALLPLSAAATSGFTARFATIRRTASPAQRARLAQPDLAASGVTVRFQMMVLRYLPFAEKQLEELYTFVDANRTSGSVSTWPALRRTVSAIPPASSTNTASSAGELPAALAGIKPVAYGYAKRTWGIEFKP